MSPHNCLYFSVGSLSCRNLSRYGAVDIKLDYSLDGTTTLQLQCRLAGTTDFFLMRCHLDGTLISQLQYHLDGTLATAFLKYMKCSFCI